MPQPPEWNSTSVSHHLVARHIPSSPWQSCERNERGSKHVIAQFVSLRQNGLLQKNTG